MLQPDALMQETERAHKEHTKATRVTVTLPKASYETVVRMAKSKRVSSAWIVRDAVDKYLAADIPLTKERPNR